jgi:hypothetical protein
VLGHISNMDQNLDVRNKGFSYFYNCLQEIV